MSQSIAGRCEVKIRLKSGISLTLIPQDLTKSASFLAAGQSRAVPRALHARYQYGVIAQEMVPSCGDGLSAPAKTEEEEEYVQETHCFSQALCPG